MNTDTPTFDLHTTAARLAALEDRKADIDAEIAALRSALLSAAPEGSTITVQGHPRWRVSPGRRVFSEKLARDVLPAGVLDAATVTKVDAAAVKRLLAPALWEACCTVGQPFLTAVKP